jgi:hypothetical protein
LVFFEPELDIKAPFEKRCVFVEIEGMPQVEEDGFAKLNGELGGEVEGV